MNLCRNGHDKDVVGITPSRRCRQCTRDSNRAAGEARRRRQGRPELPRDKCRNGLHPKPESGPCLECRKSSKERYEARIRAGLVGKPALKSPEPDGWEPEFGPVPEAVPNDEWLDQVVVYRLLTGIPVGRHPTRPEWDAFFARNKTTTLAEVSHATGMAVTSIWEHARRSGYRWPYELTASAGSRKE